MTSYRLTGQNHVIKDGAVTVPLVGMPGEPNTNPEYVAYQDWLAAGGVPLPPIPEFAAAFAALDAAITAHFDRRAAERRYESRITCAMRAGYEGPFQAEGRAFAQWMDACNAVCYRLLGEVRAGARPIPSLADVLAAFPALNWPPAVVMGD